MVFMREKHCLLIAADKLMVVDGLLTVWRGEFMVGAYTAGSWLTATIQETGCR